LIVLEKIIFILRNSIVWNEILKEKKIKHLVLTKYIVYINIFILSSFLHLQSALLQIKIQQLFFFII